jgi:predicted enzyme related to lactoylglutathione lyase
MAVEHLFASIPVRDGDRAGDFYTRLFGRPPDLIPNEHEAAWRLTGDGWIYFVVDPGRAGSALNTVLVGDLDSFLDDLAGRDVTAGAVTVNGAGVLEAVVTDPDGNRLKVGQPPRGA